LALQNLYKIKFNNYCNINKQVLQIYHRHGFRVRHIHGSRLFEHIKLFSDMDINFNITNRNEHILAIESFIQTIKERVKAIANQ